MLDSNSTKTEQLNFFMIRKGCLNDRILSNKFFSVKNGHVTVVRPSRYDKLSMITFAGGIRVGKCCYAMHLPK